jgi:hypothetical protein
VARPTLTALRRRLTQALGLMSTAIATYAFHYSAVAFVVAVLLFNVLYFFVVLPKLAENRIKLGGDIFVGFRQYRYVKAYLNLLSAVEQRRWYNLFIRHSFVAILAIWFLGMVAVAILHSQ